MLYFVFCITTILDTLYEPKLAYMVAEINYLKMHVKIL